MITDKQQRWIDIGYKLFAEEGPKGIKIDVIARALSKSRSSFYHLFGDLEVYNTMLFDYHEERAKEIRIVSMKCNNIDPDLINAIIAYKQDLLFHRQLRIHRHISTYHEFIKKIHDPIEEAFLRVWAQATYLEKNVSIAKLLLKLVVDNFYMRISKENINNEWLQNYLMEIINMVKGIENTNGE